MATRPSDIVGILRHWARETPHREAVRYGSQTYTWSALDERVRRFAAGLAAEGVRPGERIAVLDKNVPACLEATFAAASTGAANAVVNWRLAPDEVAYILDDSQAVLLFVGAEFVPTIEQIRDRLPPLRRIVVIGGDHDEYEAWLASHAPAGSAYIPSPDDCFLQLYTSGTTGFPKGAMLTHRSMWAHTVTNAEVLAFTGESVNLVAMPLYHVGGSAYVLIGMYTGARTVLVRDLVPDAVLDDITRERVTHAFFAPAVLGFFLQVPDLAERDLTSLHHIIYGGAPMPLPLMQRCLTAFPQGLYEVYGMTEASGVVTMLTPDEHRDPARPQLRLSAGRAIPGVEIQVVDPVNGTALPPGQTGEIRVRSAQCMAGYWRKPEATSQTLLDGGWLATGDAGTMDADGYVYVQDRVKDMIITGGENVYPAEVEHVLAEHPTIADVAIIGVPDEQWGESVKAVVVASPGRQVDTAELLAFCRQHLAGYKCPKSVDVVAALPRNATGKVLRRELRKPYWISQVRQI